MQKQGTSSSQIDYNNSCDIVIVGGTQTGGKPPCLIANWVEERAVRDSCGVGRSIPQRHIKRSGLLQDFTKQASEIKIADDTFERVQGLAKGKDSTETHTTNSQYGNSKFREIAETWSMASDYMYLGRTTALKDDLQEAKFLEAAAKVREEDDAAEAKIYEIRHFEASSEAFSFQGNQPKAQGCKPSLVKTLHSGPKDDNTQAHDNDGLNCDLKASYDTQTLITKHTERAGNRCGRMVEGLSRARGESNPFGKDHTFSHPVATLLRSSEKMAVIRDDDENANNQVPSSGFNAFPMIKTMPQLNVVKGGIHEACSSLDVREGQLLNHGMVLFRGVLGSEASEDGFVKSQHLNDTIRSLGCTTDHVDDLALNCYLNQLSTLKKNHVQINQLFSSLRCVVVSSNDTLEKSWDQLAQGNNELSVGDFVNAFHESEQTTVNNCLANLGQGESLNYNDFKCYLADLICLNGDAAVRGAMGGCVW